MRDFKSLNRVKIIRALSIHFSENLSETRIYIKNKRIVIGK